VDYRAATPEDEPFLREMLWLAYNWREQSVAADHWPDPDGPRCYVDGFGRPGDGGDGRTPQSFRRQDVHRGGEDGPPYALAAPAQGRCGGGFRGG